MPQLSYYCKSTSCERKNYLKVKSNNRFELQQEIGNEVKRNGFFCGTYAVTHINRLHLEIGKWVMVMTLITCVILSALLFIVGWISTVTFTIPIWFYFDQQKRANLFNKTMISRH